MSILERRELDLFGLEKETSAKTVINLRVIQKLEKFLHRWVNISLRMINVIRRRH